MSRSKSPNVFDYMEDPSVVDEHNGKSAKSPASSVSSRYQGSDAGSSEGPATPSSRSTMPSPTTSRNPGVSVAELRRKYDQDFNGATTQPVSGSPGMVSSTLNAQKERYSSGASDQRSDNGSTASPSMASSIPELDGNRRRSSHTSLRALDAEQRLKQREQEMREHMAFTQHPYAYEFTSPPEASDHDDSQAPDSATPATHQALQHYIHHPVPTRPIPANVVRSTPSPSCTTHPPAPNPPHVPEAPDLSKTTLAGYELLATHLAPPTSSTSTTTAEPHLTPLYRKFTHLHHRILLHLQDELAEMESQLRVLDEIVAQTYTSPPNPDPAHHEKQTQHHPASRRAESHPHTPPIFAHRTALLGRIFLKKQQYHAALRDFAALERDSRPAESGEVAAYRAFLKDRAPVCEGEAAFLGKGDLVVPGSLEREAGGARERERDGVLWEQTAFLAALLVLPLVISVALPDLGARVAATGLLGAGAGLVVWGARVRGRG
ncbi:hypothetical protein WHR41_04807 [Cladosporium halotolerans]|uniref:DUF6594 domain-containing protein n=1 Tax=Cladosporium halotolerans TaxID=1052096 RepID=A0AB34KRT1_9PEZI